MQIEPKTRGRLITRLIYIGEQKDKISKILFSEPCADGLTFSPDELLISNLLREFPGVYMPQALQDWYNRRMAHNANCLEARNLIEETLSLGHSPLFALRNFIDVAQKCIVNAPVGIGLEKHLEKEFPACLIISHKAKGHFYQNYITKDEAVKINPSSDLLLHEGVIIDLPEIDRRDAIVSWLTSPVFSNKKVIFVTSKPVWENPQAFWIYLYMIDPVRFSSAIQFVNRFTDWVQQSRGRKFLGPKNLPELEELLIPYYIEIPRTMGAGDIIDIEVAVPDELKQQIAKLREKGIPPEVLEGIGVSPFDFGLHDYCHFLKPIVDIFPMIESFKERIVILVKYSALAQALWEAMKILTKRDVLLITDKIPQYTKGVTMEKWKNTNGVLITNDPGEVGFQENVGHMILTPGVNYNGYTDITLWRFNKKEEA